MTETTEGMATTQNLPSPGVSSARRISPELALLGLGILLLFLPTYYDLARGPWTDPHEAHGPFIIAICAGVAFSRRKAFAAIKGSAPIVGTLAIMAGVLAYVIGRSQEFLVIETASELPILAGAILCLKGWQGLRVMWFAVVLMAFVIVWPGWVIDHLTVPLKQGRNRFHGLDAQSLRLSHHGDGRHHHDRAVSAFGGRRVLRPQHHH